MLWELSKKSMMPYPWLPLLMTEVPNEVALMLPSSLLLMCLAQQAPAEHTKTMSLGLNNKHNMLHITQRVSDVLVCEPLPALERLCCSGLKRKQNLDKMLA